MPKIELRDERDPGYYTTDNEVIDDYAAEIGVYGLAVYATLCRFANRSVAYPSLDTISDKLGISRTTVKKALVALEKAKMVHIQHRPGNAAKSIPPQSSIYSILKIKKTGGRPVDDLPQEMVYGVDQQMAGGRPADGLRVDQQMAPNKPSLNKPNLTSGGGETPPTLPPNDSAVWLQSLGLYPSQIKVALARRPIFTPADRALCEAWIKQEKFAKAHVALYTQYLMHGNLPTLQRVNGHAKTNGLAPAPEAMTEAERLRLVDAFNAEMDAAEGITP